MDFLATSAKTTSHEEVIEHGLLITSSSLLWSLLFDEGIVRAIPKIPYHSVRYNPLFSINQEILLGCSNVFFDFLMQF